MEKMINPKERKKLDSWKRKYEEAKLAYSDDISAMKTCTNMYDGDRAVNGNPNKSVTPKKVSINVRNITYELIESQVDSSIPMPKVIPIHKEDEKLAQDIETALQNEIRLLHFNELNDKQERIVPIIGGDFMHVEWDNTKGFHCTVGGISVSERHPKFVIPQPGVTEIDDMDYIFIQIPQTKSFVKAKYNVDVKDATDTEPENTDSKKNMSDDIVTVIKCYYRHDGVIGLFTWCEDYILEDYDDYQARRLCRCVECGRVKTGDVCECGSKKFEEKEENTEVLIDDIELSSGEIIHASTFSQSQATDENGNPLFDEDGTPAVVMVEKKTEIPYYKPNCIPIILRRNVSRSGKLLGFSDAKVIEDQQDAVKKLGSKMQEKILKGGSIVTLPQNSKITTTDEELKVVRVKNASDKALIDVLNMQADITMDRIMLETNYDWAKSTLGITDAYQGKYDSSATSGTAKQYSINQAAGRLESKRVMKNTAYAKLYEMMFKFMLAYADQPIPLSKRNADGKYEFTHFDRYKFLKKDAAGEFYWNDEFIFETDPTSTIMMNREAMWQQIDLKYQAGAFGKLGEPETLLAYWTFMAENDYPNAEQMRSIFQQKVQEQKVIQEQILMQQGGVQNAVPQM